MGLETATYVGDLVPANPAAGDDIEKGDDHLRMLKSVLQTTFPGLSGAFHRVISKGSNYSPASTEVSAALKSTASLTASLPAVAGVASGAFYLLYAETGTTTITPNGVETINGLSGLSLAAGDAGLLYPVSGGWAFFFLPTVKGAVKTELQLQSYTRFTAGGTADALTGTLAPAITAYTAGLRVTTIPGGANTVTGPTLNLNSLGTKTIKKRDSSGAKVALAAGDYNASGPFDLEYDGTDFILLNPILAASSQHGQCLLAKSGANLVLTPKNGNKLMINGTVQTVPSAGVTLAATGLTADTTYLIYAYMSGSTMTLEASATAHATATTTGVEIKSGDATRTLVGIARVITGPAWADTVSQRFVESWFNQPTRYTRTVFTADRSTTSASFVELNTEIRSEFVTFKAQVHINNGAIIRLASGSAQVLNAGIGVDDAVVESGYMSVLATTASSTAHINGTNSTVVATTEGYHYATMVASIAAGGTLTAYSPSSIVVTIPGV